MHKCEKQQYQETITDFDFYAKKNHEYAGHRSLRTVTHAYFTNGISGTVNGSSLVHVFVYFL